MQPAAGAQLYEVTRQPGAPPFRTMTKRCGSPHDSGSSQKKAKQEAPTEFRTELISKSPALVGLESAHQEPKERTRGRRGGRKVREREEQAAAARARRLR